jgi:hypothetical protein
MIWLQSIKTGIAAAALSFLAIFAGSGVVSLALMAFLGVGAGNRVDPSIHLAILNWRVLAVLLTAFTVGFCWKLKQLGRDPSPARPK